jgi:major membrane immunogen (membrane-anchored lipoprotein)
MTSYRTCTLLCALLLLGACGKSETQPAPKLFKDQIEVLDKAKAVDPALQKQDDEQRKSIEQQTK